MRLQGDKQDPVTAGFLCERTSRFLDRHYRADRFTAPMLRRDGELVPIGWDEALDLAAEKLLAAKREHGPASILHYRSGGFMMARGRQLAASTPVFDALLGIVASREDPIAQGRHKVWGSRALWVPPQTSTIASHLPKAVGMAFSLARARRLGLAEELPADAIVMCSFGDATVPLDEALVQAVVDVSGRPFCVCTGEPEGQQYVAIGGTGATYMGSLTRHVFESISFHAHLALHVRVLAGRDPHHIVETQFKAFARAFRDAVALDPRETGVPSTKGSL